MSISVQLFIQHIGATETLLTQHVVQYEPARAASNL
jgi:hypothetical protein